MLHSWAVLQFLEGFWGDSVVKNPPAMQEMRVRSLGREHILEEVMAAHSSTLAGKFHGQRSPVGSSPWGCSQMRLSHWAWTQTQFLELSKKSRSLLCQLLQGQAERKAEVWTHIHHFSENQFWRLIVLALVGLVHAWGRQVYSDTRPQWANSQALNFFLFLSASFLIPIFLKVQHLDLMARFWTPQPQGWDNSTTLLHSDP